MSTDIRDSLGNEHIMLLWEGGAEASEAAGRTVSTFAEPTPQSSAADASYLTNVLRDASLWQVDASGAVTASALSQTVEPGQVTAGDRHICGYFIIRGSVEEVLGLMSTLDLGFLGEQEMSPEAREILEAHATLTIAPVVGTEASLVTVWTKVDEDEELPAVPVEAVIEIIFRVHTWARELIDRDLLIDTARVNVRFDTWHLEGGEQRPGRRTAGRLLGIGRYDTRGPSLVSAYEGLRLAADTEVIESARENRVECNQGYGNCKRTLERPLLQDDPRVSLFG